MGELSFKGFPFTKDLSFERMLNLQNDTSNDEPSPYVLVFINSLSG